MDVACKLTSLLSWSPSACATPEPRVAVAFRLFVLMTVLPAGHENM